MSSKHFLEYWLKLCDAITYFNYGSQSILAMNLFTNFKLVFTQKQMAHKFNINRKYKSKTLSDLTKKMNLWFLEVILFSTHFQYPFLQSNPKKQDIL